MSESLLYKYVNVQKVPLLLAYPTCLLAANFIFDKTQNLSLAQTLPYTLVFIPLFLASSITIIYTYMNKSAKVVLGTQWEKNRVLLTLLGLFISNWILGSVRTVILSLLLVTNVNIPYFIISLAFDMVNLYYSEKRKLVFFPTTLDDGRLYLILLAYAIIFYIKDSLRDLDQLHTKTDLTFSFVSAALSAIVLIVGYDQLELSMVFVTIGCALVLNVTKLDITLEYQRGSVTLFGIISILLEVLSLNIKFTQSLIRTIIELLLILLTAFIDVDDSLFKPVSSTIIEQEPTIIHQLFQHEDTRAIFSFLLLNTSFMFVQFLYSFRSKSLGLLSDSLHMALDCTSLALGLVAGVLAKKPPSESFPFGLTKIETLAGFANGVLLIGIVAGIFIEAIERIINPVSLEKTGELLVVSFLGFIVNIVGIFAFNHGAHGGHNHGHNHGHSHTHSHTHGEGSNENMKGIFLHILADTLGSAGVVVSTLLTSFFKSNIFDPLASLFIAIMIFISALPLIKSSASNLLLSLDDKKDDSIRDILSQIATTPGVSGYTTPRFWKSPNMSGSTTTLSHGHSHSVDHDEQHSHHSHEHTHPEDPEKKLIYHPGADDHSHSHSHNHDKEDHSHDECTTTSTNLVGFIHIQHYDGENSTIIKKRVQKIFENNDIKVTIQVESDSSSCWCRP